MGEKANKFIATAGAIVVAIVGAAQFADGFWTLFGPPDLPECESGDATDLVKQIIVDNFEVDLQGLQEVAEQTFDDAAQLRRCGAVMDAGAEGIYEIRFDLTWHDRDERMIAAEVEVLRQRS